MVTDQSTICPSCRQAIRPGTRFCTRCGTGLQPVPQAGTRLVLLDGESSGTTYAITDHEVTIGREGSNDIIISDNQISKSHARILYDDGAYWIEDIDSRNGVFLNGRRISGRHQLQDGMLVKLGATILRFEMPRQSRAA